MMIAAALFVAVVTAIAIWAVRRSHGPIPQVAAPAPMPVSTDDETGALPRAGNEAMSDPLDPDRFHRAFHSTPTGMALVRVEDNRVIDSNEALAAMLGVDNRLLIGCTLREFTHPDDIGIAQTQRARLELGIVDSFEVQQRFRRTDGGEVWAQVRVSVTEDGGVPLAITHVEDITEQRRVDEQLRFAAAHDPLTGLANRVSVMDQLDAQLDGAAPGTISVMFIDLDGFKHLNSRFGHQFGDAVIRSVGKRIQRAVTADDLVARFGGDEFIVVTTDDADALADAIRVSVESPMPLEGREVSVTASIGTTTNDRVSDDANELLARADDASRRAKLNGGNRVEHGGRSGRIGAASLRLADQLRAGIDRGEIVPYYQPLVDLDTTAVIGYEVLARWLQPDQGMLLPEDFTQLAFQTGLIGPLSRRVLLDSLRQVADWRDARHQLGGSKVSVNVVDEQFLDPAFPDLIAETLRSSGVPADQLWVEINQSALLADERRVAAAAKRFRAIDVHLMVDDFGTGLSSMAVLHRFPIEAIKIDRQLIGTLGVDDAAVSMIRAVVKVGAEFGLDVIAEGIESDDQRDRLVTLGCNIGQGYLFGRPRPAELIEREPILMVQPDGNSDRHR